MQATTCGVWPPALTPSVLYDAAQARLPALAVAVGRLQQHASEVGHYYPGHLKKGISPAETGGNIPADFPPLHQPRHARHVWSCRWWAALQPRAVHKRIRHSDVMTLATAPAEEKRRRKKETKWQAKKGILSYEQTSNRLRPRRTAASPRW